MLYKKSMTGKQFRKLLEAHGWRLDRISRKSPHHDPGRKTISSHPVHTNDDLPKGQMNAIQIKE